MNNNNQKKRNFQIEAFKHKVVVDPKYAEKTWKILEHAINEIYNHNASGLSFEELYRLTKINLFFTLFFPFFSSSVLYFCMLIDFIWLDMVFKPSFFFDCACANTLLLLIFLDYFLFICAFSFNLV